MTLEISVRDYRGIERADIDLNRIALVAGQNEAGKSSLAEAVQAALTGTPIIPDGVTKKDAKYLVRDGADKGHATVKNHDKEIAISVSWPSCDALIGEGEKGWSSLFAVGRKHLVDFTGRERAKVLARYIDSEPAHEDLASAMSDLGYGDKAIDRVWQSIVDSGWDGIYTRAREYSTELKGKWGEITGEKWGKRKAEGWTPDDWHDELKEQGADRLQEAVVEQEGWLEKAIARRAVDGAEKARIEDEASKVPHLKGNYEEALAEQTEARKNLEALKNSEPEIPDRATLVCPKCKVWLATDKAGQLIEHPGAASEAEVRVAMEKHAAWEKDFEAAQTALQSANERVQDLASRLQTAERAAEQMEDINQHDGAATDEDVEKAREAVHAARSVLDSFQTWQKATKTHEEIKQNEELVAMLAPEGLRQRKLASRLEDFNAGLEKLSKAAGWPVARLDEKLDVFYGTRPYWAASASAQWRARAVIQCLMAQLDGSVAVILDEADILDTRGRNGLFAMLADLGQWALVCMTINKPGLVPNLREAGLGQSYWIEAAVAYDLEQEWPA